jgi:hypothetical protein
MRYGILNNTKVLTANLINIKGNSYIPVLINGNWQNVGEKKVSFDADKLAELN